jgi:tetratricopeptide (TPR) repeat protein
MNRTVSALLTSQLYSSLTGFGLDCEEVGSMECWPDNGYEAHRECDNLDNRLALQIYEKALQKDPGDLRALSGKGEVLGVLGYEKDSFKCFERLVEICYDLLQVHSDKVDAWWYMAEGLQATGRLEKSIESYNNLILLRPNDLDAWINKALVLQELCRYDEAVEAFENVIELIPEYLEDLLDDRLEAFGRHLDGAGEVGYLL